MRSLIKAVAVAVTIAAPLVSFAQVSQPTTRAQVKAELKQLEAAGYRPAVGNDPHYPADLQAAQARIAASGGANVQTPAQDVGGVTSGASHSGHKAASSGTKSIYFGM